MQIQPMLTPSHSVHQILVQIGLDVVNVHGKHVISGTVVPGNERGTSRQTMRVMTLPHV